MAKKLRSVSLLAVVGQVRRCIIACSAVRAAGLKFRRGERSWSAPARAGETAKDGPASRLARAMFRCTPLFVAALCPVARAATQTWIQLQSPHYLFVSDASERQLTAIALDMERFRQAFERFWSKPPGELAPCRVFVFANDAEFVAARPKEIYPWGTEEVYVAVDYDRTSVVLSAALARLDDALFRESVHYFLSGLAHPPPLWLEHGLAQLLSTAELRKQDIVVGRPIEDDVFWLSHNGAQPVEKIFAVDDAALKKNGPGILPSFYSESWAFLHYWLCGKGTANPAALIHFLRLTSDHHYTEDRFRQAFGVGYSKFDKDLRNYLELGEYARHTTAVNFSVTPEQFAVRPLSAGEVDYYVGDILTLTKHEEPARERLLRAAAALPADPRPREDLAMLADRRGDKIAASKHLADAIALGSRNPIILHVAATDRLQTALASLAPGATLAWPAYVQITNLLKTAIHANPVFPAPYDSLALALCFAEKNGPDDDAWLRQARAIDPDDAVVPLAMSWVHERAGDLAAARTELRAVVPSKLPDTAKPRLESLEQLLHR